MKASPFTIPAILFSLIVGLTFTSCEKPEPAAEEEAAAPAETTEAPAAKPAEEAPAPEKKAEEMAEAPKKPMKHLEIPDVTSYAEAKKVFLERTAEINGKKKLDNQELHEIHMSTYHLEKAVAYFAENSKGPKKKAAENLAVVVEEVHLSSETFMPEDAKKHLAEFAKQAEAFTAKLK